MINIANKTEVAIHFNERGHDLESDLKFCIFECNINFDPYRKSIETDLINMFKNNNCKILNCINRTNLLFYVSNRSLNYKLNLALFTFMCT